MEHNPFHSSKTALLPNSFVATILTVLLVPLALGAGTPLSPGSGPAVSHPAGGVRTVPPERHIRERRGDIARLIDDSLTGRGFTELSNFGGADRIGVKRDQDGEVIDVMIVDVRMTTDSGLVEAAGTAQGPGSDRDWLAGKIRLMQVNPDPATRRLAREISAFRLREGRTPEQLGQFYLFNRRTGTLHTRRPGSRVWTGHTINEYRAGIPTAAADRSRFTQAHGDHSESFTAFSTPITAIANRFRSTSSRGTPVVIFRLSGRNGYLDRARSAVASGPNPWDPRRKGTSFLGPLWTTYQIAVPWWQHRQGKMLKAEFHQVVAERIASKAAATTGFFGGKKFGLLFGPAAVVISPVAAITGGAIGYVFGGRSGRASATLYHQRLDANLKAKLRAWMGDVYAPR